ncbi:MAG: N-acetylmuramoyl-L-alanine amidase [Gemmatimonadaceae bacterium]|nr:N-acetylmuramoyl-L-alanine amidase [Gemmatimonadaceae bacterium]
MHWLQRLPSCGLVMMVAACATGPSRPPGATPEAARPASGRSMQPPPPSDAGQADSAQAGSVASAPRPGAPPRAELVPPVAAGREQQPTRLASDGRAIRPAVPGAPLAFPSVDGPLSVRVVYPQPGQVIGARDSTFILGSLGTGRASLTINGASVSVNPNGSFLAWLPFPPGPKPAYELVATRPPADAGQSGGAGAQAGAQPGGGGAGAAATARMTLTVSRPPVPAPLPESGPLVVDRSSLVPAAGSRLRGDEPVQVGVRAPSNAKVTLRLADGSTRALSARGEAFRIDLPARLLAKAARMVVSRNDESATISVPTVEVVDPDAPKFVVLKGSNAEVKGDTDAVTIVRPTPGGTYKWFLFPGTVLETTATRGAWTRVRLDDVLEAWVETKDTEPSARTAPVRRVAVNGRVTSGATRWSDVRIPVGERPAFAVDESARALRLTLHGVTSNIDIINFATNDPVIRDVTWAQVASDRVEINVHLRADLYGYLAFWDAGTFVLRVRRAPEVDPARPLAGRVIAVDAGHPPIGSTGPTGLYEGDAVLAVAEALRPMLEREGATVVMTRTAPGPVALGARPVASRRADADAFVSIHLNAHPDGVNPYRTNGSGTYYFHAHSADLARDVQRGLVKWMGLRDLGVNYDNLAVVRQTWVPAILCEGAFVILPDQEAALRTPEFQSRYAIGILEGLEDWFRSLAPARAGR